MGKARPKINTKNTVPATIFGTLALVGAGQPKKANKFSAGDEN